MLEKTTIVASFHGQSYVVTRNPNNMEFCNSNNAYCSKLASISSFHFLYGN